MSIRHRNTNGNAVDNHNNNNTAINNSHDNHIDNTNNDTHNNSNNNTIHNKLPPSKTKAQPDYSMILMLSIILTALALALYPQYKPVINDNVRHNTPKQYDINNNNNNNNNNNSMHYRNLTLDELRLYNGSVVDMPIYISFNRHIFDVSAAPQYYSINGTYNFFAGKDATRAYATGCFDSIHYTHDVRGLNSDELDQVQHWFKFYKNHNTYNHIGYLIVDDIDHNTPLIDDTKCNYN